MKLEATFSRRGAAALLLAATAALFDPGRAAAQDAEPAGEVPKTERWGDLVSVFSGDLHLPEDVVQRGSVVCIGGSATIDGDVTRDVTSILCDVVLRGDVGGNVTGVLADTELHDASLSGDLVSVLGSLTLDSSTVNGELVSILGGLDRDERSRALGEVVHFGLGGGWVPSVAALVFWIRMIHKLAAFVLILLLVLLVPERIERIGEEAPLRYATAFFVGLLGYLGLLAVLGVLTVTIVGVVPAMLAFWILKWLGIAAIFHAIGHRAGRAAGFSPSTLGAVLLVFAVWVVLSLAPGLLGLPGLVVSAALKIVFFLLVEVPAVGLVLLTRAGGRRPGVLAPAPVPAPVAPAGVATG